MPAWESLLKPLTIGRLTAKNRVEAAPTLTNLAHADQSASRELVEFYRTQARGGAGIVTVQETIVDGDRVINNPLRLNLGSDHYVPALNSVAEAIKSHGALASIQLNHGGRQAVAEHYGAAALRAKWAGFDMVMVHAGTTGGSLADRTRFAKRVVEAIRASCGPDFPIEWRMSASALVPGGLDIGDAIKYARSMQDLVDAFQISVGVIGEPKTYPYTHPAVYLPHGENVERAAAIAQAVNKPVGVVGAILDLEEAGEWVAAGKAGFVALSRGLLADSALPKKTFRGRKDEVIPCVRCNECVIRATHALPVRCAVNPVSAREDYFRTLPPAASRKRVVVVGGGPAGMQAALTAAARGHEVVLFEKTGALGGNLRYSSAPPFKEDWKRYLAYLLRQVQKSGIRVRLTTEVDAGLVRAARPDELVIAVGAVPAWPDLPGMSDQNVVWAGDALDAAVRSDPPPGARVVLAGDGGMGRETALVFAMAGRQVTMVGLPGGSNADQTVNFVNASILEDQLLEHGVVLRERVTLERVIDGAVFVRPAPAAGAEATGATVGGEAAGAEPERIEADVVIAAPNLRPRTRMVESLQGIAEETYVVGDCKAPRMLFTAVHEGFEAALSI
ncbi:MAG: FAD-dependent oxidoreductase [Thermoleophilia bacterium]|nr:FAD-dependent oxidoreductase [Thermoleophilia bacterium]